MMTGIIIQTRMGSTRLPGKVMLDLSGKPVITHVLERLSQCKNIDKIIIATTTNPEDDVIADYCSKNEVLFYRGSSDNVLSRYYNAAKENKLDLVVRITSDCPLIDPKVTESIVQFYLENKFDIVTNACADLTKRTYPRGLDTEVFSMKLLEDAFNNAQELYQKEHVTPYLYEKSDNVYYYMNGKDYSKYRWTLDTEEDYALIKRVYEEFYHGYHDFFLQNIVEFFEKNPELFEINAHVEQKKVK